MNKKAITILIVIVLVGTGGFLFYQSKNISNDLPEEVTFDQLNNTNNSNQNINSNQNQNINTNTNSNVNSNTNQNTNTNNNQNTNEDTPDQINLAMAFTSQAPTANWSMPFEDACEEASILMVHYYYQKKQFPSAAATEDILLDMVSWEETNWGGHYDWSLVKWLDFIDKNYDYKAEVVKNLTAEKIKGYLAKGIPVIVPVDGIELDNPYFSGEGPDYHVLVIKGYANGKFITNDPGTKRGKDFLYTEQNLMNSIGDWDEKGHVVDESKIGLIITPN